MKVLCKRRSVFVSIDGKSVELTVGVNEVPDHVGAKLISRGVVFAVKEKPVAAEPVLLTAPVVDPVPANAVTVQAEKPKRTRAKKTDKVADGGAE